MAIPLKMLRESKGITQAELSSMLSISPSTVGMWEQGRRVPDYENLKRIADYFNVSTDFLLGRKNTNRGANLSSEHQKLLHGFDGLNEESKRLILGMIGQLNVARASVPTTTLAM